MVEKAKARFSGLEVQEWDLLEHPELGPRYGVMATPAILINGRLGFQARVLSIMAAPKPTLYVNGLTDLKAVRRVEAVLKGLKGVRQVTVDPGSGEVFVEHNGQAVNPRDLIAALEAAGFKARPGSPDASRRRQP